MQHHSKRLILVNTFGALFYGVIIIQWLWSLIAYLPYIITFLDQMQAPIEKTTTPVVATTTSGPPSLILLIIGGVVTLGVIGITIWILIKLPASIGKAGHKATRQASEYIVPVITRHAPLSASKKQRLTARVIIDLKLAVAIAPTIVAACSYFIATTVPHEVTMLIAAVLGIASLVLLSTQTFVARWLKVPLRSVW